MSQCQQCGTTNRSGAHFCSTCGNRLTIAPGVFDPSTGRLLPGVTLDRRYTIERIVSRRGGMSTIYLARDERFGNQHCIIKEMLDRFADPADRQQAQAWFAREASTLRNLKHPNIPQVVDHFSQFGRHYLVMDWLDGENLEDALVANGVPGLPEDRVLLWGIRLCEVLEYLHNLQPPLLFRDLKPANLILTQDNEIHLIDFGIARKFDPGQLGKMTVIGTPGYSPPEQYSGRSEPRSDLYALGATLHHLLTGREPVPFSFQPAHVLNPNVSSELSAVLERVLDNDIERRYESATKMKQALQMCQGVFNIGYGFVRPYLPPHTDDLGQILVDLYSRDGSDFSKSQIMTHLVLVLDVSGSMDHPEKYPFLLKAVKELSQSEFMGNDDTLSVVVFSEDSEVRVASRPFAECKANPDRIVHDIDDETGKRQVKFGGHTYLAPGLREALAQVRAFRAVFPDAVNRLYILTDGQIHDEQIACQYTTEIRQLDVEINAYGFGTDFDDKVLAAVMQGCRGATIKPILDANELVRTFGHVAEISGNIIATDAEFAFALASNVRVGDVFCYRPRDEYFGGRAFDMQKVFRTKIGALEKGRNYSYCFEVGLMPSQPGRQEIGMINLSYNLGRRRVTQYQRIMITRTADAALTGQVDREAQAVVDVVHGLRDKDSASQLRSLKARRMLAVQARSHSTIIQAFDKAISDLEQGGSLSSLTEVERRLLTCQIQTNLLTAVK